MYTSIKISRKIYKHLNSNTKSIYLPIYSQQFYCAFWFWTGTIACFFSKPFVNLFPDTLGKEEAWGAEWWMFQRSNQQWYAQHWFWFWRESQTVWQDQWQDGE